ncbi:MAG: hypothetical protein E7107_05865 [Prevotella sp.]|jgi:hypothetical protein|nr:hypothetical protein [Prevotella sp.]
MKKLLFISAICMLSLNLSAEREFPSQSSVTLESLEDQQSSNWEYLGKISATYQLGTSEFYLYVKVISGKEFYQVRKGGDCYAVTIGKYTCQGKNFNASFKEGEKGWTYYFNI